MTELVRTLLLAAVGAIDLTESRVRSVLDELVQRGELAAEEARSMAARWAERPSRGDDLDVRVASAVDEWLGRANVASHAELVRLAARVTALEADLASKAPSGPAE